MERRGTWLCGLAAALVLTAAAPAATEKQPDTEITQGTAPVRCKSTCRGLGIEKVTAGEEHCGLVSRERKRRALDLACSLAEEHREELVARARERAAEKCDRTDDHEGCACEGRARKWENVYTHVLSQRCWSECGWAYVIECDHEGEEGGTH
jgi:hypothetical protein